MRLTRLTSSLLGIALICFGIWSAVDLGESLPPVELPSGITLDEYLVFERQVAAREQQRTSDLTAAIYRRFWIQLAGAFLCVGSVLWELTAEEWSRHRRATDILAAPELRVGVH